MILPCGGCGHDHHDDTEVRKDNAKRGFGQGRKRGTGRKRA